MINVPGSVTNVPSGSSSTASTSVDVYARTTTALPAYTYANGSSGVGATMTANANGAFPTVDGQTLVANDTVQGLFLQNNGAAFSDNGVYMLTQQGTAGTPWIATRYTGCDTSTEIPRLAVRVLTGFDYQGSEFKYCNKLAPTVGTDALAWVRTDPRRGPNDWTEWLTDFDHQVAAPASGATMPGPFGGTFSINASSAISVTSSTATKFGAMRLSTGTATGAGATISLIAASNRPFFWQTEMYYEMDFIFTGPNTLSDGSDTYRMMVGLAATTGVAATDGVWIEYTQATDTHWLAVCRASSASTTAAGPTVTINQTYRWRVVKYAGETSVHFYCDGTEVGTGVAGAPTGASLTFNATIIKSAGANARLFDIDFAKVSVGYPNRRAA